MLILLFDAGNVEVDCVVDVQVMYCMYHQGS
jgi:hypothetical protein